MDIEVIRKLIKKYQNGHGVFVQKARKARDYYKNRTDILLPETREEERQREERPLRNADNRIPFNFHGLLVNQKAAYMFTRPPAFDVGSKAANKQLVRFLGDPFSKTCKDLCIDASNCSVGWLHLWKDPEGEWKYAKVPPEEIIPVWNKSLDRRLEGVFRVYRELDEETGDEYTVYEYWNETECNAYRLKTSDTLDFLQPYPMFLIDPTLCEYSESYSHGVGEIPFFPFFNNNTDTGDLDNIKPLIDTYCKVFSGFVNDLEDIQEVIFVLTNYGGQDLREFLQELKTYKTIKVDSGGGDDRSGVSTLTIELPVEARKELLTITRKCIFEQGQGIDPDPENFGNSSGVALNFLYALLELKAGLQETEFRLSFARFVRCVCRLQGIPIKDGTVLQTWTRTAVRNDQELSQIAQQSEGVISKKTIVTNHPWVDDAEQEMEELASEEQEAQERMEPYLQSFGTGNPNLAGGEGDSGDPAAGNGNGKGQDTKDPEGAAKAAGRKKKAGREQ